MSDLGLAGKAVLITGAAGGLGLAFARGFGGAGARVAIADIDEPGALAAAADLRAQGHDALGVCVDVSDEASTLAMAARVADEFGGGIDVLVNNAALYAGLKRQSFLEIAPDTWDRVMAVNLKGPFLCVRAVHPFMAGRGGKIVNVASATVLSGSPQWMHYVASKGGVIAMTRVMARELGDDGITVNALAPGFTLTEASLGMMENAATYGVDRGALKRAARPEDIVGAALWLTSHASDFVTGQTLVVDGGRQFV